MLKDKKSFQEFRKEMANALEPLCEKYDCHVKLGNITYDDYDLKIKVEFEKNGEDSQQKIFTEVCGLYGLKPDDYGKTFVHFEGLGKLEKQYQLLGINVSAPKYPIIVKDLESDQMYRVPKETFQMFKRK